MLDRTFDPIIGDIVARSRGDGRRERNGESTIAHAAEDKDADIRGEPHTKRLVRTGWDLIAPVAEAVGPTVHIEGITVQVDPRLSEEARMALLEGHFGHPEVQVVKSQLSDWDTVMELGAGIGVISSLCAKRVGFERVCTYEGNPFMERHIRRTYRLNRVAPTLEMCLIGEHAGLQSFYVAEDFRVSSTIGGRSDARVIRVPVRPFNLELQRVHPTFLIVDMEGAESELCRYANFHHVHKIAIEVHDHIIGHDGLKFVRSRLQDAGFRLNEQASYPTVLFFQRD